MRRKEKTVMKKMTAILALAAWLLPLGIALAQDPPPPAPPVDNTAAPAPQKPSARAANA